jgi:hypothetical protein
LSLNGIVIKYLDGESCPVCTVLAQQKKPLIKKYQGPWENLKFVSIENKHLAGIRSVPSFIGIVAVQIGYDFIISYTAMAS